MTSDLTEGRFAEYLAKLRRISIQDGPSELRLLEALFVQIGEGRRRISFLGEKVNPVSVEVVAFVPLKTPCQYNMLVCYSAMAIRWYEIISYDAQRRMGSHVGCNYESGFELLRLLGTESCAFETSSKFDGIVLKALAESPHATLSLSYDELRRKTRIKRGLPSILFGLERGHKIRCARDGDRITSVVLIKD